MYGLTPSLANALRQAMLVGVPTFAIEEVIIYDNTSSMPHEMVAQRLGVIPLICPGDLATFHFPQECPCHGSPLVRLENEQGCPKCLIIMELKVECHGGKLDVTFGDLKPRTEGALRVAYPQETLVELVNDQVLRLKCYARKGVGKTHFKWAAATSVTFRTDQTMGLPENDTLGPAYHFIVESAGQMPPQQIVDQALQSLVGNLETLRTTRVGF
jgi:DNA-directed RNA polymerase alpha subunit